MLLNRKTFIGACATVVYTPERKGSHYVYNKDHYYSSYFWTRSFFSLACVPQEKVEEAYSGYAGSPSHSQQNKTAAYDNNYYNYRVERN